MVKAQVMKGLRSVEVMSIIQADKSGMSFIIFFFYLAVNISMFTKSFLHHA